VAGRSQSLYSKMETLRWARRRRNLERMPGHCRNQDVEIANGHRLKLQNLAAECLWFFSKLYRALPPSHLSDPEERIAETGRGIDLRSR